MAIKPLMIKQLRAEKNCLKTYQSKMEVNLEELQSPNRIQRQKALKNLLTLSSAEMESSDAAALFDKINLLVIKCYSDRYENCRFAACSIITKLLSKLPANDYYLDYIVPTIRRRIGQPTTVEESEEMRLVLLKQLTMIVMNYDKRTSGEDKLKHFSNDIIDILLRTLLDANPTVQIESCLLITYLADATETFQYQADALVDSVLRMLPHRRSANREAAIEAIAIITVSIHAKSDILIKIFMAVSPLVMDPIPKVRLACGRFGCKLMLDLRDRYSYFERLIPLVLCCLDDSIESIQTEISKSWSNCGEQYFRENEEELAKLGLVDRMPQRYPFPEKRPALGCRKIIERALGVVPIVLREMSDWNAEVRIHALKLLGQIILHAERTIAIRFLDIFPVIAKACMDSDTNVIQQAEKISEILGRLIENETWCDFSMENLEKKPTIGGLRCFLRMLVGSALLESDSSSNLQKISTLVVSFVTLDETFHGPLIELSELLVNKLARKPPPCEPGIEEKHLHKLLVYVLSFSQNKPAAAESATTILQKLAGHRGVIGLHNVYLGDLIDEIEDLDALNSAMADPIRILYGITINCPIQQGYMENLLRAWKKVIRNGNAESKIRILSSISVALLNIKNPTEMAAPAMRNYLLELINDIVLPMLIWRAGQDAESVRTMAAAVFCAVGNGAPELARDIFPQLTKELSAIIEDGSYWTRSFALQCVANCGPMNIDVLEPLVQLILSRLDDPSSNVRLWAGKCLANIGVVAEDESTERWQSVQRRLFSTLILHLENPEIKLQTVLLETIGYHGLHAEDLLNEVLAKSPSPFENDIIDAKNQLKTKLNSVVY